jgi:hypothetical protein
MPPKRQRKVEIYADSIEIITDKSTKSSPRAKRKQPETGGGSAAPAPKRQAFASKSCNSRDNSFRQDTSFVDEKPSIKQGENARKKDDVGLLHPKNAYPANPLSALKAAFKPWDDIKGQLDAHGVDLSTLNAKTDAERFQEVADYISKEGCSSSLRPAEQSVADIIHEELWTPALLSCFANTSIEKLDLSSPASFGDFSIPELSASELLAPLFTQHCFTKLTTLNLRNRALSSDDIALLRLLPSLTTLDLCATGIRNMALYNLVCHRHTLTTLNIANNEGITDEARFVFGPLYKLKALFLRGTNMSMPALRQLVANDLAKECRLLSIPSHAIETMNNLQEKYAVDIPAGYIEDPTKVDHVTVPVLKRNLELHAKFNKDVQVTGTKVELIHRLKVLLGNRQADMRIMSVLGRAD